VHLCCGSKGFQFLRTAEFRRNSRSVSCQYKKPALLALHNSAFLLHSQATIRKVIAMFYNSISINYHKGLFKKYYKGSTCVDNICENRNKARLCLLSKDNTEFSLSSEYNTPANFLTKSCFQRKKTFLKR